MANSKRFKEWHKLESARRMGQVMDVEKVVDELMSEKYIKVEYIKPR